MHTIIRFILFLTIFVQIHASDNFENLPSLIIDEKLICDLRLIANQSLSPLNGFMNQSDYLSVLNLGRLTNGSLFPLPIVLPVPTAMSESILLSEKLLLKNRENCPLAIILVEDIYTPDLEKECLSSFGTLDSNHPSVPWILSRKECCYIGGKVQPLPYLNHLDTIEGICSPKETRSFF